MEANFAHFIFQKHHIMPRDYYEADRESKAFMIASVELQVERERAEMKKAKRKRRKGKN